MTGEGDLVLVHMDNKPAFFARIEAIEPDMKPEWFHVKMLVLQVPLVVITWILRSVYVDGTEFTMGGRPVRLEKVIAPPEEEFPEEREEPSGEKQEAPTPLESSKEPRKVISIKDRRKKDH